MLPGSSGKRVKNIRVVSGRKEGVSNELKQREPHATRGEWRRSRKKGGRDTIPVKPDSSKEIKSSTMSKGENGHHPKVVSWKEGKKNSKLKKSRRTGRNIWVRLKCNFLLSENIKRGGLEEGILL